LVRMPSQSIHYHQNLALNFDLFISLFLKWTIFSLIDLLLPLHLFLSFLVLKFQLVFVQLQLNFGFLSLQISPNMKVDLVIMDIPSNMSMSYVFDSTSCIPVWNQNVDNFINFVILFSKKLLLEHSTTCSFSM